MQTFFYKNDACRTEKKRVKTHVLYPLKFNLSELKTVMIEDETSFTVGEDK